MTVLVDAGDGKNAARTHQGVGHNQRQVLLAQLTAASLQKTTCLPLGDGEELGLPLYIDGSGSSIACRVTVAQLADFMIRLCFQICVDKFVHPAVLR